MIGVIAYFGICAYANFTSNGRESTVLPEIDKAQYAVHIVNTGNLLFTNSYDDNGGIYVLHGFWESKGDKWQYSNTQLTLDSKIFGKIIIRRR